MLENEYLVWFDYKHFFISINLSLPPLGIGKFALSTFWHNYMIVSPQDRDEVKLDMMLANMRNVVFPLVSTIVLPKVSTLCCPLHLKTLAGIYWNLCVKEKSKFIYLSSTKPWLQCRSTNFWHSYFIAKVCKINNFVTTISLALIFDNKCCPFRLAYTVKSTWNYQKNETGIHRRCSIFCVKHNFGRRWLPTE